MLRLSLSCVVVVAFVSSASAQPQPIQLWLTPARPPTPALRYQLFPDARLTSSGDAAPLYKQVGELLDKKGFNKQTELFESWSKEPLDRLPKEEMRKELAEFDEVFDLLDKAARCDRCDWGLLDRLRAKGIGAPLPELQPLRTCALLLSVRARLEMAEGRFDKAAITLRNGFALARNTGEGDTLINFLVGAAIAAVMNGQLDAFVAQPGAPNLYYALTDLPAPLISTRKALQGERIVAYGTFPGLAAIGADLNAGNLSEQQLTECAKMLGPAGLRFEQKILTFLERRELVRNIQNKDAIARQALIDAGRPRDKVEAMPHLQVALLHALLEYDVALDNMIVWNNLPYWEMKERLGELKPLPELPANRLKDPKAPALVVLAPQLMPNVLKVTLTKARTERKIALLRTIEALRYHAATHDGKLPTTLAAVTEVPIPFDPLTGQPFQYALAGDVATLAGPAPDKESPTEFNYIAYELHIRK